MPRIEKVAAFVLREVQILVTVMEGSPSGGHIVRPSLQSTALKESCFLCMFHGETSCKEFCL